MFYVRIYLIVNMCIFSIIVIFSALHITSANIKMSQMYNEVFVHVIYLPCICSS